MQISVDSWFLISNVGAVRLPRPQNQKDTFIPVLYFTPTNHSIKNKIFTQKRMKYDFCFLIISYSIPFSAPRNFACAIYHPLMLLFLSGSSYVNEFLMNNWREEYIISILPKLPPADSF